MTRKKWYYILVKVRIITDGLSQALPRSSCRLPFISIRRLSPCQVLLIILPLQILPRTESVSLKSTHSKASGIHTPVCQTL